MKYIIRHVRPNKHNFIQLALAFLLLLYMFSEATTGFRISIQSVYAIALPTLPTATPSGIDMPAINAPLPGSVLTGNSVTFEWANNGVDVTTWRLWVGSRQGARNLFDSGILISTVLSATVSDLPTDGSDIFARLFFRIDRVRQFSDFHYIAAQLPLLIDLKSVGTDPGIVTRIHGSTGNGRLGLPVAGRHDCDGDGFADAGFAAIQANPLGRSGAGEIALVFGDGTIGGMIDTAGFQEGVLKIAGDQEFEVAGAEIWIDDVTGDGLGDLLIGRQNHTSAAGREGSGALTILVGGPELRTEAALLKYLDLRTPPSSVTLTTFLGAEAYDRLGIWMRTGDVTGDGIVDIVVGSDEVDAPGETNRGAVYVIRGGSHLTISQVVDLARFGSTALEGHIARIHPPPGSDNFHMGATCQIADLDGNGRAEVLAAAALNRTGATIRLLGAPVGTGQGSGGSAHGTLYIAWDDNFPDGSWPIGYEYDISASPGGHTIIEGDIFNDTFGEEIIGGLDFSGDGNPELFVGDLAADGINGSNSGVGHVFYDAGRLKDMSFDLTNPPATVDFSVIEGPLAEAIGGDTVTQGDFDGDGLGDLVFGSPNDEPQGRVSAGSIHILYGQPGGWPALIDLSTDGLPDPVVMRIVQIHGANGTVRRDTGDTICYSAASGDIDGDGHTDLIVNEMEGNGLVFGTIDVGNLLLISGAAMLDPVQ